MRYIIRQIIFAVVALTIMNGCTKEDSSSCYTPYSLMVSVSVAPEQLDRQPVQSAVLYVFDTQTGEYLGQHPVTKQQIDNQIPLVLDYRNNKNLTVVCWGNAAEALPRLSESSTFAYLNLTLKQSNGYAISPDDLYFGIVGIGQNAETASSQGMEYKLSISRIVSSMVIKAKKLKEWVGTTSNDFSYVVRQTQNTINYKGEIGGSMVDYRPQGIFDIVTNDFTTPVFNLLPSTSGNSIEVDIYYGNTLVYTISKDENNQPIRLIRDKLLNILIDFNGTLKVTVTVTGWGDVDQSIII